MGSTKGEKLKMSEKVKLTIDGKEVEVKRGTTVLQAAKQIGIDIPTLCFLKEINEAGDCRMCIVEIEGRRGFVPSCITRSRRRNESNYKYYRAK